MARRIEAHFIAGPAGRIEGRYHPGAVEGAALGLQAPQGLANAQRPPAGPREGQGIEGVGNRQDPRDKRYLVAFQA